MKNSLVFLISVVLISACHFDGQRQYDQQYPATLTVFNRGESTIEVESIYSSSETDAGFVLNGFSLEPRGQKAIRISYDVLSALEEKAVEFKGQCIDGTPWLLKAEDLTNDIPSVTEIVFMINPCAPPL